MSLRVLYQRNVNTNRFGPYPQWAFFKYGASGDVTITTDPMYCRESFMTYLWSREHESRFDRNRVRIALRYNRKGIYYSSTQLMDVEIFLKRHESKMYRAVHLLNVLEKEMGIEPTTSYRGSTDHDEYAVDDFVQLFDASPLWIHSPHLLSLFCLILRGGSYYSFRGAKSIDDLAKVFKSNERYSYRNADLHYIGATIPWWRTLLLNWKYLYSELALENWNMKDYRLNEKDRVGYTHEGILTLCKGETHNYGLGKRWQEVGGKPHVFKK